MHLSQCIPDLFPEISLCGVDSIQREAKGPHHPILADPDDALLLHHPQFPCDPIDISSFMRGCSTATILKPLADCRYLYAEVAERARANPTVPGHQAMVRFRPFNS
jgi:hypothetical protein